MDGAVHGDGAVAIDERGCKLTSQKVEMRSSGACHALYVAIILHGCFDEILVNGREDCGWGVEVCVEKHFMRLDLECAARYCVNSLYVHARPGDDLLERFPIKRPTWRFR